MKREVPNWHQYFLALAKQVATRSKDPHTQVGCVVVGPNNEIRSTGYNSLPRGVNDNIPARFERPEKYEWVEHSERNAIYSAARVGIPLEGCTLYCQWVPCINCARACVQAGIKKIVIDGSERDKWESNPQWVESMARSKQLFTEAGVELVIYPAY